jgi:ElaB/YqjD/DUF883 family membrane-anchored ribosome-binding protein
MQKNGTTKGSVEDRLGSIRDSVRGFVDRSEQRAHAIRTRSSDAIDRTSDLIKAHPLKAVGIAFGIGYLAMRLFRR